MIRLSNTTQKLQAVLAGAVATNQLHCVVCYSDDNGATYIGGSQYTSTNGTTAVDICGAPGASTIRDIDYINCRNRDTAAATIKLMVDVSATDSELIEATLAVGDSLIYTHGNGWNVLDAAGQIKTGSISVSSANTWTGVQTFRDAKFEITDDVDTTKKVTVQCSGITPGTTRTLTIPDASITVAGTNLEQIFTAQQTPMNGTLTDGATIDWNGDMNGQSVKVTLGGNRTMNAPTNINEYAAYVLRAVQDATGSRTLAWNSAFKFAGGTAPTLTTTANAVDVFTFIGGASNVLYCVGQAMDVK